LFFALDNAGNRVHITDAVAKEEYRCPICGSPLIQKKGDLKRYHFAHESDSFCADSWMGQYDMSEWHYAWQERFPAKNREVVCCHNGEIHRADVLIGNNVIEFQHSSLSPEDFARRNNFYHALGYHVIWLFDCVDAYYHEERIEQIEGSNEKYKWSNPIHTLDAFSPRYDNATVFLQMTDETEDIYGDPGEISILKLNWVSPDGMRRFCAREQFTEDDFLRLCGLEIAEPPLSKSDIFDKLTQTRDTHNNYCYSTCPKRVSMLVPHEDCDTCEFRVPNGCVARFQNLELDETAQIAEILRDLDGRIIKINAVKDGQPIALDFPVMPTVAKTLTDLWNTFTPLAVARFRNLRNGYEVQLTRDPNEMARKYRKCYGKLCRPGGDYDKNSSEVFDWDKPYWVIIWFKRAYRTR